MAVVLGQIPGPPHTRAFCLGRWPRLVAMAGPMATRVRRVGVEVIDPSLVEAALKHAGWTQAALARELEVDQKTVSNWTSGRRPVYRTSWYAIALALGLPKDWEPAETPPVTDPTLE